MRDLNIRNKDNLTEKEFLDSYKPSDYERPSVTVDMLLFTIDNKVNDNIRKLPEKELKILLIKRGNHPYMGCYAIPGGFVEIDEDLETAVYRELKEETNVENVYLEQLYTFGDVYRDPRMRVVTVAYMALVDKTKLNPIASDDADEVRWFSVKKEFLKSYSKDNLFYDEYYLSLIDDNEEIKIEYIITESYHDKNSSYNRNISFKLANDLSNELAFDQIKMVNMALERLKNKIEYTPIAFSLLPKYFTLSELQRVYEIVLNKKLIKANFRRKIQNMVVKTDLNKEVRGYRPAKYYTFNNNWEHHFLDN